MSLLQSLQLPRPAAQAAAKPAAKPAGDDAKLRGAAEVWRKAHAEARARVDRLKSEVRKQCEGESQALLGSLEAGLAKLDKALGPVDLRLADALAAAAGEADEAARAKALKAVKDLVAECVGHLNGEPLIAQIDQNPFGVSTGLKALFADGLAKAGAAIG